MLYLERTRSMHLANDCAVYRQREMLSLILYHCCLFEVPLLCDEEILESNSILDQEDQQWSEGEKEGLRDKDPFAIPEIHVKNCLNKQVSNFFWFLDYCREDTEDTL